MDIVDAQVHLFRARPERPWELLVDAGGHPHDVPYPAEASVAAMDACGVAASVISLPPNAFPRVDLGDGVFREDNTYAEEAAVHHPGRFASVPRFDPRDPDVDELVASARSRPGVVGIRCVIRLPDERERFAAGGYDPLFRAAERHDVPMILFVSGRPEEAGIVARAHPGLQVIIDHMGLHQPPFEPVPDPWEPLPRLLALAAFPNMALKLSGAPSLSKEPYPFLDLWPRLRRILDAFGPERIMWGTDITRCRGLHTLAEAVGFLRYTDELSPGDKELILGASLRRLLRWPAS